MAFSLMLVLVACLVAAAARRGQVEQEFAMTHPGVDGAKGFVVTGPGLDPSALAMLHRSATGAGTVTAKAGTSTSTEVHLPMQAFVDGLDAAAADASNASSSSVAVLQPVGTDAFTKQFRSSVVRIHTVERKVDWFRPYARGEDAGAIGSGFAVKLGEDAAGKAGDSDDHFDPIFVTNAHVVQNAHTVRVQLPAVGREDFEAYVPVIYEDFDLALVRLVEPQRFLKLLESQNTTLNTLPILQNAPVVMGLEVAAVGFPRGCETLKMSRGVIAGTEEVDGRLVFQSTAPISPGNSGGPLFALPSANASDPYVIGVNFAAASESHSQNNNFVVPVVHIRQLLRAYHAPVQHPGRRANNVSKSDGNQSSLTHASLQFAPIDAIIVEANDALYRTSGGCHEGVFLSKFTEKSALYQASPRLPNQCFITSVGGIALDNFGMGRTQGFLGDPIPFESLLALVERVENRVNLTVCKDGTLSEHVVSMVWRPEYEQGIRTVTEPYFDKEALDFEVFSDVTVMQMTTNHILKLMKDNASPTIGRWLMPDKVAKPRLLVVQVQPGTYASRVLAPGMVVDSINGRAVRTLADYRGAFDPANGTSGATRTTALTDVWRLQTERGTVFEVPFQEALLGQLQQAQQESYLATSAVVQAGRVHGLVKSGGGGDQEQALARVVREAYVQGARDVIKAIMRSNRSRGFALANVSAAVFSNASDAVNINDTGSQAPSKGNVSNGTQNIPDEERNSTVKASRMLRLKSRHLA